MKAPPMKESDLARAVYDLANLYGWLWMHQRPARTATGWRTAIEGAAGFPDVVLVRPPRVVFLELKADRGTISPLQAAWLDNLMDCPGVECWIIRPSDLDQLARRLA